MSDLGLMLVQNQASLADFSERVDWLDQMLSRQKLEVIDLVSLPELFCSGYNIGSAIYDCAAERTDKFYKTMTELAQRHQIAIHYGYPELSNGTLYNSAQMIDSSGEIILNYRKRLIPPGVEEGVFSEGKHDSIVTFKGVKIATLICYDAEFPENVRRVAVNGAELILVPTALAAQWGVVAEKVIPTRAFENGVYVCYANQSGSENDMLYYGGSCIVDPQGIDLARLGTEEGIITATISTEVVKRSQARLPYCSVSQKVFKDEL
jgi:predicted amidohydrolase